MGRLFGLGDFSAVEYSIEQRRGAAGGVEHGIVLDLVEKDWRPTGSLMLGAETAFGPVYLAYGRAETGDDRLYLSVGTTFRGTRTRRIRAAGATRIL
ncbi:MAG: hypothetical protein AAGF23_04450 [Acidobacteriota bacterium]